MQGRKVDLLILIPVTNQGLLAVCRVEASLHYQHLPRDQRPSPEWQFREATAGRHQKLG